MKRVAVESRQFQLSCFRDVFEDMVALVEIPDDADPQLVSRIKDAGGADSVNVEDKSTLILHQLHSML